MSIQTKLSSLRNMMKAKGYDFYLVPSSDPHNSEYVPACWNYRAWISGFDGSAGEALIGLEQAFLSTDGRYFLQAEQQLDPLYFELVKQTGFVSELDRRLAEIGEGKRLAIDPKTVNIAQAQHYEALMASIGGEVIYDDHNLIAEVMTQCGEMQALPKAKIFKHEVAYAGQSVETKLATVREAMRQNKVEALILSALDEVAWMLNIRGSDVDFNPVAIAYAVITLEGAFLYIDADKVDEPTAKHLRKNRIEVVDYHQFFTDLEASELSTWLDPKTANYAIYRATDGHTKMVLKPSPVVLLKACKNDVEIAGAKEAHLKDAVAYLHYLYWLENNWQNADEISSQTKLAEFRAQQPHFMGESFNSISGYASNGAIIHYRSTPETCKKISNDNLYLLDSGGQYLEGTTDITRTFHLGQPTAEHKRCYTLVLQGHLALVRAIFPLGTKGEQLDVLARQYLWNKHMNYAHGTGHGVGSFLCVHEGPQKISSAPSNQALLAGMIVSNEPGVYFNGHFGIRIENLCVVVPHQDSDDYYTFEDLTMVPYARNLIDVSMLSTEEITQINAYHQQVKTVLMPRLNDQAVKDYLEMLTQPL